MRHTAQQSGFTLSETLVVVAIVGILVSLVTVAVQRAREAANRASCANNLHQIGLALQSYYDLQGTFPPGVRNGSDPYPFMSWCTRLLPFLEQGPLWADSQLAFSEDPFFRNNPPHIGLATVLQVFGCPSDPRSCQTRDLGQGVVVAYTSYLGVEGTNQSSHDGVLFLNSQVVFADIADGASNTIIVGERPPSADGVYGWWYGGWGQSQDGSCDMDLGASEINVSEPACPPGPYAFGPGNLADQCDVFHFWSTHIGGAQFLFADGSTHFLSYDAAGILPALATRAGGESVLLPE